MFSPQQNQRRGQNRFCLEVGGWGGLGEVAQTMYTHVSKCKNDKIKREKQRNKNVFFFFFFYKKRKQEGKTGSVWGLAPVEGEDVGKGCRR
jgi:hypothetical protein